VLTKQRMFRGAGKREDLDPSKKLSERRRPRAKFGSRGKALEGAGLGGGNQRSYSDRKDARKLLKRTEVSVKKTSSKRVERIKVLAGTRGF